jgi:hypothetical protein
MNKLIVLVLLVIGRVAAADQAPVPPPPPSSAEAEAARKTCVEAMNANPDFAKSIVATADKQIDARTIAAHEQAAANIAENERHVLLAYAAMWIIAALFVLYLWRRQQALRVEIAQLRKDLDAAGKA